MLQNRLFRLGMLILACLTQAAHAASLPLGFIENDGQADKQVAFYARSADVATFVTREGALVHSIAGKAGAWSLGEKLGAPRIPKGEAQVPTRLSYFSGSDPRNWRRNVASYERIDLGEPWPGVQAHLRLRDGRVEKIFTATSGRATQAIRVEVDGATRLDIAASGELVAISPAGEARFSTPIAWQVIDDAQRPIDVRYSVDGNHRYGFAIGAHDANHPVIIDPFLGATYVGGTGTDTVRATAVHPTTGNVVVAGYTEALDFPIPGAAAQVTAGGGADAFIATYSADLRTLLAATFLGGTLQDAASDLRVHPTSGEIIVVGLTRSNDFPGTTGGFQTARSGTSDLFVARLSADLGSLLQATYFGGTATEGQVGSGEVNASVEIDPASGDIFIASIGGSNNVPGTAGGAQPTAATSLNGFLARFTPSLATGSLVQSTYFSGNAPSGSDASNLFINDLAIGNNSVYISGWTRNPFLAATAGAAQPALSGVGDFFAARFSTDLTTLQRTTYLGGSAIDEDRGSTRNSVALAIHPLSGDVYLAGGAESADFPGVAGGFQATHPGGRATVIARLSSDLSSQLGGTWLGGTGSVRHQLLIHPVSGEVFVAANGPVPPILAGGASNVAGLSYAARLGADLTALSQATSLGALLIDSPMAFNSGADVLYVAGNRGNNGNALPACLPSGAQTTGGSSEGAIVSLSANLQGDRTPTAFNFVDQTGVAQSSVITSEPIAVTGIDSATAISIAGGVGLGYSINGGDFTSATGVVCNADTVRVRHTSSAQVATTINTTLTIGDVADTFSSTTVAAAPDTTPNAFSFIDQANVALNTVATSNVITISGINTASPISIVGGEYWIVASNGTGYVSTPGTVENGDEVQVRHTTAATAATSVNTTLTVGGVSDTFTSTTLTADSAPDAFAFVDQTDVAAGTTIVSNSITVSGINTPTTITVVGGEYAVNGGSFTGLAGTVANGDTVQVTHRSADDASSNANTTLTIGGVSDTFTSTTAAAVDTTPDAFSFTDQSNVALATAITSNTITVSGINAVAAITVTGGMYSINGASFTAAAGVVDAGDTVAVRVTSSATASTAVNATLTIGGVADIFTVTTQAAAPPPPPAKKGGGGSMDAVTLVLALFLVWIAGRRRWLATRSSRFE